MFKKFLGIFIIVLCAKNPVFADNLCQDPWVTSPAELTALNSEKRSAEIQKLLNCAKQATTETQNRLLSISSLQFDQLINDLIEERTALQKLSDDRKQAIGLLENDLVSRIKERDEALDLIKSIEAQLSDVQEKLSKLGSEREKLNAVIAENSLTIQNYQQEIFKLEKERYDLNEKIKSLTSDNTQKDQTISDLRKARDAKTTEALKAETKVHEQESAIASLDQKIQELSDSLSASKNLQRETENRLSEALGTIGKLNSDLDNLKSKNSDLENKNSEVNKKFEEANKNVEELQASKKTLEDQRDHLVGNLSRTQAERDELSKENMDLNTLKSDLERQLESIKKDKSALLADLNSLKTENEKLKGQVDALYGVRSEFFAKLKEKLKDQKSIRIVGDRFIIQSEVLFNVGSPDLNSHGISQIKEVAKLLKEVSVSFPSAIHWVLQVNGHTDIQKIIPGGKFASNWELSTARALTVVKLMQTEGVAPNHLVAAGFGEYQPVDDGKTQESFAKNRRIELKLTDDGPYK